MENKTYFWTFLSNHTIEIPIIQRDYAQGRCGKENLRKNFLLDLKRALDTKEEMKLDFVYGSIEGEILNPLDGQQRLTTLWLLHWYIAFRAGKLDSVNEILRNFTYETRISSREFCDNLCKPENFISYKSGNIIDYIISQTWFYSSWMQDPTIQSMLRMLGGTKLTNKKEASKQDGIEEIFYEDFEKYWEILISDKCPIVFYYLHLNDFGLSDDLYIKMNARGKQLTSFENFKADFIGYIKNQAKSNKEWEPFLDLQNGVPIKIDTSWTELFWKHRSVGLKNPNDEKKPIKRNNIDEIFFAFFNRFFWNELFVARKNAKDYLLKVGKGKTSAGKQTDTIENENSSYCYLTADRCDIYNDFSIYKFKNKEIPIQFFQDLILILDRIAAYNHALPKCTWDKSFEFIPKYKIDKNGKWNSAKGNYLEISDITQLQRVVFFSICKYFKEGPADVLSIKQWIRVVYNLISGEGDDIKNRYQIRNWTSVRNAIEFIDTLDSHNVYESLKNCSINNEKLTDFEYRIIEERDKALQILNNPTRSDGKTWESVIIEAENTAFFKGSISFLFHDENNKINWENFDKKFDNAKQYFCKDGVHDSDKKYASDVLLLRAFISRLSKVEEKKFIFDNERNSWRYILQEKKYIASVNKILLGDITQQTNPDTTISKILNSDFLSFSAKQQKGTRLVFNHYYHKALYQPGSWNGVFLNYDSRDQLLYELHNKKIITISTEALKCGYPFLVGWYINFDYKENSFVWNPEGTICMKDNKEKIVKYTSPDKLLVGLDSLIEE